MVVSLLKLQKQRKQRCHAESHCPMSLLPCGLKMIENVSVSNTCINKSEHLGGAAVQTVDKCF